MSEIVRVVRAEEVEMLTVAGWRLTEILSAASEVDQRRVMTRPSGNDERGQWRNEEWTDVAIAVTRPLFVLRKDAEARDAQLEREISALQTQLAEANRSIEESKKAEALAKQVQNDLAQMKVHAESVRDKAVKDFEAQRKINDEHDKLLSLIRREIGEAKFRELDGSHSSCVHCIARQT